jgi:nucleoside-diphosphate-sugar epimerase
MASEKPAVLIIGGLGYIGRFLAKYIHDNNLASELRLVDKVLPQLAWLAPEFEDACSSVNFMQADASQERKLGRNLQQVGRYISCTTALLTFVMLV